MSDGAGLSGLAGGHVIQNVLHCSTVRQVTLKKIVQALEKNNTYDGFIFLESFKNS